MFDCFVTKSCNDFAKHIYQSLAEVIGGVMMGIQT